MEFINKYSREKVENQYAFSKEFIELDDKFILAIGSDSEGNGLISRIESASGNTQWEKVYWEDEKKVYSFKQVIQINNIKGSKDKFQYIILTESKVDIIFTSINKHGEVLWSKHVDFKFENNSNLLLEPLYDQSGFYVAFSKYEDLQNNTLTPAFIGRFDQEANLLIGRSINIDEDNEIVLNAITAKKEGLVLAGNIKNDKDGYLNAIILDFDINLKQQSDTVLITNPEIGIQNIKDVDGKLLVSGYIKTHDSLFISVIDDFSSITINYFQVEQNSTNGLMFSENEIYVLGNSSNSNLNDILYCFDWNLNIEWAKTINVNGEVDVLSINNNINTEYITCTLYSGSVKTIISYTSKSFDSCKTELLITPTLEKINYDLKKIDVILEDINYEISVLTQSKNVIQSDKFEYCPIGGIGNIDLNVSTIIASPNQILADGTSSSVITLNLLDSAGNLVVTNLNVSIVFANGVTYQTILESTANNGGGIYTANVNSVLNEVELVAVSFTIDGIEAIGNEATIDIYQRERIKVPITEKTLLQSPNFYLQAAGSTGDDSTKGIHLRWAFAGALGEKHLPKGNYSGNAFNFNRPEGDFVKVSRAPYQKSQFTLNLGSVPQVVNDTQRLWVYKFNEDTRLFFVLFKNTNKYDQVRTTINPMSNPTQFIQDYGDELIEIENKRELFFACEIDITNSSNDSSIQTEALAVSENIIFTPKAISFRKEFDASNLNNVRLVSENGRCIRFNTNNCNALIFNFEFYSDFIEATNNNNNGWTVLGDYALTLEDSRAYNLLEPAGGLVEGNWLRFNDEAYVNVNNYHHKWNGVVEPWNKNVKNVVESYIELSESLDNPQANEFIDINLTNQGNDVISFEEEESGEGLTKVSNLDLLRLASYDYHTARMLGLGVLNWEPEVHTGEFIYIAQYYTEGDLEDGLGAREVDHLSMSLPTSIDTQRLPTPIDLKELIPGLPSQNDETIENSNLSNVDGYSFDGKKRYISIYSEDISVQELNPEFYANENDYNGSELTIPIYAGLEYRHLFIGDTDDGVWDKPELSHKKKYLNIDATSTESYETVPLVIPEENNTLYIHRQSKSGTYYYGSYGINWFSRAVSSGLVLDIETLLRPTNTLLPPSNINALLIRPESPLMFSSQNDQARLSDVRNEDETDDEDETLIRLSFDYHSNQELISYQIPVDTEILDSFFVTDPTTLYPDNEEIFAEEIEIFFRNTTPKTITAKAVGLREHDTNPTVLHVIETESYLQASTGETLLAEFPEGTTAAHFIGSVFLMSGQQFIIHQVTETANGLDFAVFKQQISNSIMTADMSAADTQNLILPEIVGEGYFTVVENMQNTTNWGESTNPHGLKVNIGQSDRNWHRELIYMENDNSQINKYIEKTRGIWEDALVEKVLEEFQFQAPGTTEEDIVTIEDGHRGLYKITFNDFKLSQHSQFKEFEELNENQASVEWSNGVIRLFTDSIFDNGQAKASRKIFQVFRTENIGDLNNNLVLYINDPNFQLDSDGEPSPNNDEIIIGENTLVNYYPGYKVYLYHNESRGLTEGVILPTEGEGNRNSIFGLRSVDNDTTDVNGHLYRSKFSVPAVMFAQELIEAKPPEQPKGALYATRPDFFGRSTYTITTKYQHKPFAVLFYRSDNQSFLNALYKIDTINLIKEKLDALGGNEEEYFTNRWEDFLNFSARDEDSVTEYNRFPPEEVSEEYYRFPLPDKPKLLDNINKFITAHNQYYLNLYEGDYEIVNLISSSSFEDLQLNDVILPFVEGQNDELRFIHFIQKAIENTFLPLNELPIIYNHIEGDLNYVPVNEKQNVRDENGYLLTPEDSEYKMAPMMKIAGTNPHETYYTDFNLDGASNNVYFYAAKELSSQMKMSAFSSVLGPIKLVNTNPPEAPKIKSVHPVLENQILGIDSTIEFEINSYPEIQNIKKINVYRTSSRLMAESVQSMTLIKTIDIVNPVEPVNNIWKFNDDFSDLDEVPYREQLYYRVTVSREVEYAKANYNPNDENETTEIVTEYAPSKASKLIVTMVTEVANPPAPILNYSAAPLSTDGRELPNVILEWVKTCYNGKYHIYKMTNQGNWVKIHQLTSNLDIITLPLADTDLESETSPFKNTYLGNGKLQVSDSDNTPIYHHFKAVTENTSGMLSTEEHILTILQDIDEGIVGGIGIMIIGNTFKIR